MTRLPATSAVRAATTRQNAESDQRPRSLPCGACTPDSARPGARVTLCPARKWRFDFCWPAQRVAGGGDQRRGMGGGRHTRPQGYEGTWTNTIARR